MAMACESTIPPQLQAILPANHPHHLCSMEQSENGFSATLRIASATEKDALKWLQEFQESSKSTWRVKRTYPTSTKYVLFKREYRCHHGQQRGKKGESSRHSKDTDCMASLQVIVKRSSQKTGRKSRSSDPHILTYPTSIKLSWCHNHTLHTSSALKYRDVNGETNTKLAALFHNGHSPSSALNILEMELQMEDPEGYATRCADRAWFPDLQFCYRLYYKIFEKSYGSSDGIGMIHAIDEKIIAKYNEECGTICAKMSQTSDDQLLIAICTPLMRQVHTLMKHSGELAFIDSTGGVDRHGSRIFLLLTHSSAGGLPLGVLITSNEQEATITQGLTLLQTLFPSGAFGGKCHGPETFITDDCLAERKALQSVFPQSSVLLCTFHVLQAVWRWLWDAKHGVAKAHRQCLYTLIKQMVYAKDPSAVDLAFNQALRDPLVKRYACFGTYMSNLYERRQVWAQAFRKHLLIRGNNTNNYAEAAMRVLKDSILQRSRAFNVPQLVDFVLYRLEGYYQRKLLAVANSRPLKWVKPQHRSTIQEDAITKVGERMFYVKSQTNTAVTYTVDMQIGICTCFEGQTGGPCKHQEAIVKYHQVPSSNFPPSTPAEKALFWKIATGRDDNVPDAWLQPLQPANHPDPVQLQEAYHPVQLQEDMEVQEDPQEILQLQDPQLVKIASLQAQRDLHNAFDRSKSPACHQYLEEFDSLLDGIKDRVRNNPETFAEPAKAMIRAYCKLGKDQNLSSALRMFGRYCGINLARRKVKRKKQIGSILPNKMSGPSIGVQPTAIARRKLKLGGRKKIGSGRPTKQSSVKEHGYVREDTSSGSRLPKRVRFAAPHSLSHAVMMSKSLGKTHSAK